MTPKGKRIARRAIADHQVELAARPVTVHALQVRERRAAAPGDHREVGADVIGVTDPQASVEPGVASVR